MKNIITYTLAATLAAGASAHQHGHARHHRRQEGTRVQKRSPALVTEYIVAATETVYELAGEQLENGQAEAGINDGELVVVGESPPSDQPPAPAQASTKAALGAQFVESKAYPEPTSVAEPEPTTTAVVQVSSASAPAPAPVLSKPKPAKSGAPHCRSSSSSGSGISKKFPSGKIPCSKFPSDYGAIALDWLDIGGWSGIQYVPDYTPLSTTINEIITAIAGDGCTKGAMCSYACPPGYQKTQWPKAQGSAKESIGGLYCNKDGYLELTREEFDILCDPGAGGVSIQNDLDESVCTCRTDYPGSEAMVIPTCVDPGCTAEICNPNQNKYYIWDGSGTSAQYYVNKKGYPDKDACVWNSPLDPLGAGNWSPAILGVGQAADGITYISLFQNLPTSHAKLDYNVEITGDISSECSYIDGKFTGGGSGCTTGLKPGGKAVVRYF